MFHVQGIQFDFYEIYVINSLQVLRRKKNLQTKKRFRECMQNTHRLPNLIEYKMQNWFHFLKSNKLVNVKSPDLNEDLIMMI